MVNPFGLIGDGKPEGRGLFLLGPFRLEIGPNRARFRQFLTMAATSQRCITSVTN